MKRKSISILFVIKKNRINTKGLSTINTRITYNNIRKEFSTGIKVLVNHWNSKQQYLSDLSENGQLINNELKLIKNNIYSAFLKLSIKETQFSVDDIYDQYIGKSLKKEESVLDCFGQFLKQKESLIGKDLQKHTYLKYDYVRRHLGEFIRFKNNKKDLNLKILNLKFINDFEFYLKTKKNLGQATINKISQRFRAVIRYAISEGYLISDPFILYKPKKVKKNLVYLDTDELRKLEQYQFTQPRLNFVKDLFIFSCYTGLAYNELFRMEKKHIVKGFDGFSWIKMQRQKTSKPISVPLLAKGETIIEKYNEETDRIFPQISNQKYNSYLKEIADIVGIEKSISTHMARRTFATTVLLYNDIPIEIVSELLGHSSIKITQESYGKIVQSKVSQAMNKLREKFICLD